MTESQNTEWKQRWDDKYLQWVCAFANSEGGTLLIGVDDSGGVVGVENAQQLLELIPSKVNDGLGILSTVNLLEDHGKQYIEIITKAYSVPISCRGKYYQRSGSTTRALNGAELSEFLLRKSGKNWDEVVVEDATMDDIDHNAIKQWLSDSQKTGRLPDTDGLSDLEILQKLHLAQGEKIKRSGLVLFAKQPSQFVANCKVMVGRFGQDSEDLKFQEVVEGNLVTILREVQTQLNHKFLTRPVDFVGMMRQEKDEYPVAALREMLLNALVHKRYGSTAVQLRVFDDRLSVWNEGELPSGLSVDSLKVEHNSKPANPLIAEVCFKAGYIDTWGRGTLKIFKACREAGLPEPLIVEKDGGIEATLFKEDISVKLRRSFVENQTALTNDVEQNIVVLDSKYNELINFLALGDDFLSEKLRRKFGKNSEEFRANFGDKKALLLFMVALDSSITASKAAGYLNVSSRTVQTYLNDLKKSVLTRVGPDKGGYWSINIE